MRLFPKLGQLALVTVPKKIAPPVAKLWNPYIIQYMTSILLKILSWWIPKRRYSLWHCNVLELLIAACLFMLLPSLTRQFLYPPSSVPEEQSELVDSENISTETLRNEKGDESHHGVLYGVHSGSD